MNYGIIMAVFCLVGHLFGEYEKIESFEQFINLTDDTKNKATALHYAAVHDHIKIVALLLDNGANATICINNRTLIYYFIDKCSMISEGFVDDAVKERQNINKRYIKIIEKLIQSGALVNLPSANEEDSNATPLHRAAEKGLVDIVTLLLNNNALVNAVDGFGRIPLHLAAKMGCDSVVKLLLDKISSADDINKRDKVMETPLTYAIKNTEAATA